MKVKVLMVLAAAVLLAGGKPKDDAGKKDLDALQGTWKGASGENDGKPVSEDDAKARELTFKGPQYSFKVSGKEVETGTVKLDSSKTPKTMDITITTGDDKGKTQLAVYQVDADTLKICYAAAGAKERPKELSTKAGTKQGLLIFKRAKP